MLLSLADPISGFVRIILPARIRFKSALKTKLNKHFKRLTVFIDFLYSTSNFLMTIFCSNHVMESEEVGGAVFIFSAKIVGFFCLFNNVLSIFMYFLLPVP